LSNQGQPFSMAEGAVAAHEMFQSYVKAGFTEPQALHIVTELLKAMTVNGPAQN
jgi:hypothetical protein